jgi:hypothetical protein
MSGDWRGTLLTLLVTFSIAGAQRHFDRPVYNGRISVGRGHVVGVASRYELDGLGFDFRWEQDCLHRRFSTPLQTHTGAHPTSRTKGAGSLSRG